MLAADRQRLPGRLNNFPPTIFYGSWWCNAILRLVLMHQFVIGYQSWGWCCLVERCLNLILFTVWCMLGAVIALEGFGGNAICHSGKTNL